MHIVGARPQFIKVFVVIKAIRKKSKKIKNFLLHTGQHYDKKMSEIFFKELQFKKPDYHIDLKKNNDRTSNIAKMIKEIGKKIDVLKPSIVLIYGDTDSTLAGAISAKKKGVKLIHIEAGMRSHILSMAEEQNRLVADSLSDYFITVSKESTTNLIKEGVKKNKIYEFGDIMFDSLKQNKSKIKNHNKKKIKKPYIFFTLHRDENSNVKILNTIAKKMSKLNYNIYWPVHPKISNLIKKNKILFPKNLILNNPISYLETLYLILNSEFVVSDSGGVLREAYFLNKKTFILRNETEWPDLIKNNSAKLIGNNLELIINSKSFIRSKIKNRKSLGSGNSSKKIASLVTNLD